jgi:hypothetical protein
VSDINEIWKFGITPFGPMIGPSRNKVYVKKYNLVKDYEEMI